ncbi:MFS general substrate transporter [Ascodesmis nigricans]|uniref:MFS general substrate transporter n=1 Tax=Ascodesmis nigricans TaxID=341454 RepID=A0A4S2MW33_9PEZI|nr:MFS general substrate transporter [Ascodesmis nigricans]
MSSSSSSPNAPKRYTPPSETPTSPVSPVSDDDLPSEDGFELRQLSRRNDDSGARSNESGHLLKDDGGSEDHSGGEEEVLYDAFGEEGARRPSTGRRRRHGRDGKGFFNYSLKDEKKVVRKLDRYLVGSLALLYMLSFLDRSNIGNAKIAGMDDDLDLTGDRYESILTAFYMTYIAFEWMTLLWKVFPAHAYVGYTVIAWGVVASLQALANNYRVMIILRALLGIAEAAFGPGVPFYLSLFYRREELAFRTGLFISAAPLATAYAGFLAYAITSIPSPIAPWRLLFILEGFPSIIAGFVAFYVIPDSPGDAWFLKTTREREIARRRLIVVRDDDEDNEDEVGVISAEEDDEGPGIRYNEIFLALKNVNNWITASIFFLSNISFSSLPVFLPTILHSLKLTTPSLTQALTVPPYLLSFFTILLTSNLSDRHKSRSIPLLILSSLACLGYIILGFCGVFLSHLDSLSQTLPEVVSPGGWWNEYTQFSASKLSTFGVSGRAIAVTQYLSLLLTVLAIFPIISLVIVWNGNNSRTSTSRGVGMAMLQMLGQCGPLVGTRLYPSQDAPGYVRGSFVAAAAMGGVVLAVAGLRWRLGRENRKRWEEERRVVAEGGRARTGWRYML